MLKENFLVEVVKELWRILFCWKTAKLGWWQQPYFVVADELHVRLQVQFSELMVLGIW